MKKHYKIIPEEFQCNSDQIKEVEKILGFKFPESYKEFLLEYNGGIPIPNCPKNEIIGELIFPIKRFYSVGDLKMIGKSKSHPIYELIYEDFISDLTDFNPDHLLIIGECEIGSLLMYFGKEDYGQICYSNFSGGEGLSDTNYYSIYSLLDDLKVFDIETLDISNINPSTYKTYKVFSIPHGVHYPNKPNPILYLERFKELLDYYGDPNLKNEKTGKDVVEHYLNNPTILEYLFNIGATLPDNFKNVTNPNSLAFLVLKGLIPKYNSPSEE